MCPTNAKWYRDKKRPDGKTNYEFYQGTKTRIKYRTWLWAMNKKLGSKKWDWLDLDHKNGNPSDFKRSNLKLIPHKANRTKGAAKSNRLQWHTGKARTY